MTDDGRFDSDKKLDYDKLKDLQDILVEKYEIEKLLKDSPEKLSTQEGLVRRLKEEFINKNEEYEKSRTKLLTLKADLAEAEAARERGEKGMDSITTHREYEALDKEIKDATEKEQHLRKELQDEEKRFEDQEERLKIAEQDIQNQEAELNEAKSKLSEEEATLKATLEELNQREAALIPEIDPEIRFKFERIIKSKHNSGIVAVKGNVCDGCHMILPEQFANEVHDGEKIVFCPYCSRILYYAEDDSGEVFHLDNTGSLADLDDDFDEAEYDDGEDYEDDGHRSRDDMREIGFDM